MLAISVDPPEQSRKMSEQLKLPFPVLSDLGHKAIDDYAILDKSGKISVAAVFVIDKQGIVRWSYLAEDYKIRPLDEAILEALGKLK